MKRLTYGAGILVSLAVLLAVCGLFAVANRPVIADGYVSFGRPPRLQVQQT